MCKHSQHSEGTLIKLLAKYYIGTLDRFASPRKSEQMPVLETDELIGLRPKQWVHFKLEHREMISPDTIRLLFALTSPAHRLGLPTGWHMFMRYRDESEGGSGVFVMRAYTPTSLDCDHGSFELVVKIYHANTHPNFPEGGKMSQYLGSLVVGDSIECKGPVGHFEYVGGGRYIRDGEHGQASKLGFICGGTGITPAFQIIKFALDKDPNGACRFVLLFANKTERDILLRKELDELAVAHPDRLHLHYTISEPPMECPNDYHCWAGSIGRVNDAMVVSPILIIGEGPGSGGSSKLVPSCRRNILEQIAIWSGCAGHRV
jgi:nitrate reductase (NAD(P)H)